MIRGIPDPPLYYHMKVTGQVKDDLRVWDFFLRNQNYKVPFKFFNESEMIDPQLYTDASLKGWGICAGKCWKKGDWATPIPKNKIALAELWVVIMAVDLFGPELRGEYFKIHVDNKRAKLG